MAVGKKPVKIHYRRFDDSFMQDGRTLEDLIRAAMASKVDGTAIRSRFSSRLYVVADDNYFVNFFEDSAGSMALAFGDVLHFTNGYMQALFQKVGDAEMVQVRQLPAPERDEYVHSQMFWMVKGNHVFVLQSQSLKTNDFEEYLSWLLRKQAKVLESDVPIVLGAKFDVGTIGGDIEDIQEIIIGGVVSRVPDSKEIAEKSNNMISEKESVVTQNNDINLGSRAKLDTARNVLVELFGSDAKVDGFLKDIPEDADLKVHVHIGYQTRKKKIDRVALKHMEVGLRNLPDSQIQVRAKGQNIGADGSSRLHHVAHVDYLKVADRSGTLLDPVDVQRAMVEAYSLFLNNGKITT